MKRLLKRIALTAWNTFVGPIVLVCTSPIWLPLLAIGMVCEFVHDEWVKTK